MRRSERAFQTLIFFSRWLAAPFLIGLLGGLLLLLYRFFADLAELAIKLPTQGWHDLIVGVLNLIDIALTGNLVLIVIFSGYENFIRNVDADEYPDWPAGLIDVDFAALKQKILGSVAVIAAIDALAWYLDLEGTTDTAKLAWAIAFPLMFVAALLMLAIADRLGRHGNSGPK
jgi:uncharacterized protein (TIGR00645 family)